MNLSKSTIIFLFPPFDKRSHRTWSRSIHMFLNKRAHSGSSMKIMGKRALLFIVDWNAIKDRRKREGRNKGRELFLRRDYPGQVSKVQVTRIQYNLFSVDTPCRNQFPLLETPQCGWILMFTPWRLHCGLFLLNAIHYS